MAGYIKLSKTQERVLLGKTASMYREGCSAEEIALKVKQPIGRVLGWINRYEEAEKKVKQGS